MVFQNGSFEKLSNYMQQLQYNYSFYFLTHKVFKKEFKFQFGFR